MAPSLVTSLGRATPEATCTGSGPQRTTWECMASTCTTVGATGSRLTMAAALTGTATTQTTGSPRRECRQTAMLAGWARSRHTDIEVAGRVTPGQKEAGDTSTLAVHSSDSKEEEEA